MDSKKKMREAVWERFELMQELENGPKKEDMRLKLTPLERYNIMKEEKTIKL